MALVRSLLRGVGDEDSFRIYHASSFGWHGPLKFRYGPMRIDVRGHLNPNS